MLRCGYRSSPQVNPPALTTDTLDMILTNSTPRPLGVDTIVLKHPTAATNNQWQVEIRKAKGAPGCFDALNASFASEQSEAAENYARRMMRILRTDRLERVA